MPEFAAFYFTGLVACLALTILYVVLRRRRRESHTAHVLQANLQAAGYYWSDGRDAVVRWDKEANELETRKTQKAVGLTGTVLALLSWAGVGFLLIIMLSERFFARSRRERRLFTSRIATTPNLTRQEVQEELDRLEVCNAAPSEAVSLG
jgi:hypothetical protein